MPPPFYLLSRSGHSGYEREILLHHLFSPLSLSMLCGERCCCCTESSQSGATGYPAAGIQSTSILGIVSEYGDKLRFVTDQRAWNVDNPEMLEGHEGHYIRVNAQIYPDKGSIHIIEVKMPTASEIRENDVR